MAYYCPNCNEPVKNSDLFCPSCGVKLTDEPVDVDLLRKEHARTSGNVQFKEVEQEPIHVEEVHSDPYEEYRRHTYDYKREQRDPRNSYTYERSGVEYFQDEYWPVRSKVAAGVLAILFGGFGIHKVYLGKITEGILMLLFSWTCIPAMIGLIEGIIYLAQSDEEFSMKNKVRVM